MQEFPLRVTRTVRFSAAHREADGRVRGHDYRVDVTLSGRPDPVSGLFVNLADLDALLTRELVVLLADRMLDQELPELSSRPVSCETLVLFTLRRLELPLREFAPAVLHSLRVHENDDLYAEWERG
jgi:6-pyruvoyltetrahydropterin/6-carboxytetrahydropterin synthase